MAKRIFPVFIFLTAGMSVIDDRDDSFNYTTLWRTAYVNFGCSGRRGGCAILRAYEDLRCLNYLRWQKPHLTCLALKEPNLRNGISLKFMLKIQCEQSSWNQNLRKLHSDTWKVHSLLLLKDLVLTCTHPSLVKLT